MNIFQDRFEQSDGRARDPAEEGRRLFVDLLRRQVQGESRIQTAQRKGRKFEQKDCRQDSGLVRPGEYLQWIDIHFTQRI